MLYHPSLLGLSLLVLTCASPTLGAVEEPSSTTLHSPPTSALIPKPLHHIHRHHYHRQHHQAKSAIGLSQAANGDPLATSTLGSVPSATDSSLLLPSNGPAVLPSTGATVLSSAAPTHNVFATSDQDDESQGAGPIDDDIDDDRSNNAVSEPDPGVEDEDLTDPDTTITPSPTAEDSSTPTAALAPDVENTPPAASSVSPSVASFVSTPLPPLVIVPVGIPSSRSQLLTTNPVAFPTVTPAVTPVASSASPSRLAPSPGSSSAPFLASPAYGSPALGSASSVSSLLPTSGPANNRDLNHPNPASSSPQSERSKKAAVLAGFLILGTLGAIGVAVLCSYCGLYRCCRRYRDRGFSSLERTAEEGLSDDQKPVRVNLDEKWSIIPGSPPPADVEDFVETLPRDAHAHTLSCSTCPPDSLNGVRGGVPGGVNRAAGQLALGWVFPEHRQLANVVPQPLGENATHIPPSLALAFANVPSEGPATQSQSAATPAPTEVQASAPSSAAPGTTPPDESAMVSSSGDSYMTCDSASKYSMASGRRTSGGESVVGDNDSGSGGTADTDAERPSTPEGSHSSSTTGSPSVLMTPEQSGSGYGGVGVVDVALQASPTPVGGGLVIARPGETEGSVGGREESEWDVVAAYSYAVQGSKGSSIGEFLLRPLTPVLGQRGPAQKAMKKNVRERRATGVGITGKGSKVVGPVALGERKVMVVHG